MYCKLIPLPIIMVGLLVLCLDILSKYFVHATLPMMGESLPIYPYGGIPLFQNFLGIEFSITHITNRGAAWGTLGGYQDYLLVARVLLIGAMIVYLTRLKGRPVMQLFLSLVICGALGNVIDYFVYGHVVDMFNFVLWGYPFPVFNVADSAVCVGIFGLIVMSIRQDMKVRSA